MLIVFSIILATILVAFWNPIKSLMSLKKVNDYPFYTMTYYGDYGFDKFLKVGAKSDEKLVNLAFLGYNKDKLPTGLSAIPTLIGPYLPFNGMNEKGLVVAWLKEVSHSLMLLENQQLLNLLKEK